MIGQTSVYAIAAKRHYSRAGFAALIKLNSIAITVLTTMNVATIIK
jgi:hypothetical protein